MRLPKQLEIKQLSHSILFFNIVSVLCFSVSAYFSISLFLESGTTGLKQSVNVISAIALEFSKVGFFLFCGYVSATKKQIPGKPFLWALCAVLFAGSMFATASYFFNSTSEKSATATKTDDRYQEMKSEIAGIDTQIKELQDTASKQRSIKHISASKATLEQANKLREERKTISERIGGYSVTDTSEKHFEILAKFIGSNPAETKAAVFLLLSVVLECCGIGAGFWSMHARAQRHELEYGAEPMRNHAEQDATEKTDYSRREIVKDGPGDYLNPAFAKRKIGYLDDKEPLRNYAESEVDREYWMKRQPLKHHAESDVNREYWMKPDTGTEPNQKNESVRIQAESELEPILKQKSKSAYSTSTVGENSDDERIDDFEPSKDEIIRYVRSGFASTRPAGYWQSRRWIADECGFDQKKSDIIHKQLKGLGLVSVRNQRTFPAMSETEMLKRLEGDIL